MTEAKRDNSVSHSYVLISEVKGAKLNASNSSFASSRIGSLGGEKPHFGIRSEQFSNTSARIFTQAELDAVFAKGKFAEKDGWLVGEARDCMGKIVLFELGEWDMETLSNSPIAYVFKGHIPPEEEDCKTRATFLQSDVEYLIPQDEFQYLWEEVNDGEWDTSKKPCAEKWDNWGLSLYKRKKPYQFLIPTKMLVEKGVQYQPGARDQENYFDWDDYTHGRTDEEIEARTKEGLFSLTLDTVLIKDYPTGKYKGWHHESIEENQGDGFEKRFVHSCSDEATEAFQKITDLEMRIKISEHQAKNGAKWAVAPLEKDKAELIKTKEQYNKDTNIRKATEELLVKRRAINIPKARNNAGKNSVGTTQSHAFGSKPLLLVVASAMISVQCCLTWL